MAYINDSSLIRIVFAQMTQFNNLFHVTSLDRTLFALWAASDEDIVAVTATAKKSACAVDKREIQLPSDHVNASTI